MFILITLYYSVKINEDKNGVTHMSEVTRKMLRCDWLVKSAGADLYATIRLAKML